MSTPRLDPVTERAHAIWKAQRCVVEAAQTWYARELSEPHRSMQWPDALEIALIELERLEAKVHP